MAETLIPVSSSSPQARRLICAVTVLYFPDENVWLRLQNMLQQADALVVIDNSGEQPCSWQLPDQNNIYLIRNNTNLGIASALNQGASWASERGFSFILLFDQDTEPLSGMSELLLEAYEDNLSAGRKVVVGSNYFNGLGKIQFLCGAEDKWQNVRMVITSGTLLSLELFYLIGPFREEFFIDAVDTDYCLRARRKGIGIVRSCMPLMLHSIGRLTPRKIGWKRTAVSNHNPERRYYIARNNVILIREYWRNEPKWALRKTWYLIKTFILIILFEQQKLTKTKAFIRGIIDGARSGGCYGNV